MVLYSIYDKVADEFGPIYEAKNDMVASRAYAGLVKPEMAHDYELYAIGKRFNRTGEGIEGDPEILPVLVAYDNPRKVDVVIKYSADKNLAVVEVVNHE